jgi:anti-anti-sigma factor
MSTPPQTSPLVVSLVGSVTVVRLDQPVILSGGTAEVVSKHLDRLCDAGSRQILINCANVRSLTSMMISKLFGLSKRLGDGGGALALSDVTPDVREILDLVRLPQLVRVHTTEQEALDGFGRK